jgi:hypothetical protein
MVIGVSDTGIDENSCYFRDTVNGKVTRGAGEHIVTGELVGVCFICGGV